MNRNLLNHLNGNEDLHKLKSLRFLSSAEFRAHRAFQKKKAACPDEHDQQAWFNSMKIVLEELDMFTGYSLIPFDTQIKFLDVGCCPGGFSSSILSRYPNAAGVGVSLPVEQGGHHFLLEEDLQSRFQIIWADVTTKFNLASPLVYQSPYYAPLQPSPSYESQKYDLILIDGHPLRHTSNPLDDDEHHRKGDKLLIAQLLIALRCAFLNIGKGSTVIIKLSKPDRTITAQIMYLFDVLSAHVWAIKPVHMHATRSTFYFIAAGVGHGSKGMLLPQYIHSLMQLWSLLCFGSGKPKLKRGNLDFIISECRLKKEYLERLQLLANCVWQVERASLEGWHNLERFKQD